MRSFPALDNSAAISPLSCHIILWVSQLSVRVLPRYVDKSGHQPPANFPLWQEGAPEACFVVPQYAPEPCVATTDIIKLSGLIR